MKPEIEQGAAEIGAEAVKEIMESPLPPAADKAQGEWTTALVSRWFDAETSPEEAIKRICAKHNAALAAKREKWIKCVETRAKESDKAIREVCDENQQLREQLTAREKEAQRWCEKYSEAKKSLAAAQAAIAEIKRTGKRWRKDGTDILENPTTALDAAIEKAKKEGYKNRRLAAAQQPLVDLLNRSLPLIEYCETHHRSDAHECAQEVRNLLAKVKEGK